MKDLANNSISYSNSFEEGLLSDSQEEDTKKMKHEKSCSENSYDSDSSIEYFNSRDENLRSEI